MGLYDRISRVVKANLNDVVSQAEEPEKILEQSIIDMQEDLVHLRQAVAQAIATQKRTRQQYNQAITEQNNWHQRAQLALSKGDENLAREALIRKKSQGDSAAALKATLDQQAAQIKNLKRSLIALEQKISEAKTKRDLLKSRIAASKAQEELQNAVGRLGTSSAKGAFERMEEKVLMMEARAESFLNKTVIEQPTSLETKLRKLESDLEAMKGQLLQQQAATEQMLKLNATALSEVRELINQNCLKKVENCHLSLEKQFEALLTESDSDDELMLLKEQLRASSTNEITTNYSSTSPSNSAVDKDLEELKRQMDQL